MTKKTKSPVVSIQGEIGSYSYKTVAKRFGKSFIILHRADFKQTFDDLHRGKADYAILPFRNVITGEIPETFRLLFQYQPQIYEILQTPLDHALLGIKILPLNRIKNIYSHPQALSQCTNFLNQKELKDAIVKEVYDTAGAKIFVEDTPDSSAIIASKSMAKFLGMKILAYPVQNYPRNRTTFFLLGSEPREILPTQNILITAIPTSALNETLLFLHILRKEIHILQIFTEMVKPEVSVTFFVFKIRGGVERIKGTYKILKEQPLFSYFSGLFKGFY